MAITPLKTTRPDGPIPQQCEGTTDPSGASTCLLPADTVGKVIVKTHHGLQPPFSWSASFSAVLSPAPSRALQAGSQHVKARAARGMISSRSVSEDSGSEPTAVQPPAHGGGGDSSLAQRTQDLHLVPWNPCLGTGGGRVGGEGSLSHGARSPSFVSEISPWVPEAPPGERNSFGKRHRVLGACIHSFQLTPMPVNLTAIRSSKPHSPQVCRGYSCTQGAPRRVPSPHVAAQCPSLTAPGAAWTCGVRHWGSRTKTEGLALQAGPSGVRP